MIVTGSKLSRKPQNPRKFMCRNKLRENPKNLTLGTSFTILTNIPPQFDRKEITLSHERSVERLSGNSLAR